MINRRPRTLPERNRTDSTEYKVDIIGVDKNAHTIYAQVNGCRITAVCREKADPEIYTSFCLMAWTICGSTGEQIPVCCARS